MVRTRRVPFGLVAAGLVAVVTLGWSAPAGACGGLVAPNGAVRLQRTTTLAAYHDGIEHYVTSFVYAGGSTDFGSIIPLPGVPTDVRRAGSWTLQRLERETHPAPAAADANTAARFATAASAQVILHTTVDALDINVLSGGGPAVLEWVKAHGYQVSDDAPAMLDFYAERSPIFLAARFDAAAAAARGQNAGDGTPVQITIPTPQPWVPLHILGLAKVPTETVQADVYLLTDREPALLDNDTGVSVRVSQAAGATLLDDLRSDRDSTWIPESGWLTEVDINTASGDLNHDLAVDPSGAGTPNAWQAAYNPSQPIPAARYAGIRLAPPAIGRPDSNGILSGGHRGIPAGTAVVALGVFLALVGVAALVVAGRGAAGGHSA